MGGMTSNEQNHLRHLDLSVFTTFGGDTFGRWAEKLARSFGTPRYILIQSLIVACWIALNAIAIGIGHWDPYPFILLNLAFSLQAAYAAPLILLAQTRQADRDKEHAEADARHREELAAASTARQRLAQDELSLLQKLLEQNTALTEQNAKLSGEIDGLVRTIHARVAPDA